MPLLDSPYPLCAAYTPKWHTHPARVLHAPYTRLALTRHLLLALYLLYRHGERGGVPKVAQNGQNREFGRQISRMTIKFCG